VFVRSGGAWSQQAQLKAADAAASDYFGISVAVSGDTAVVGAYGDDTAAGTDAGSAYTVELAPYAPASVRARAVSSTRVDLSWTDSSALEEAFEIERSDGLGGWETVLL